MLLVTCVPLLWCCFQVLEVDQERGRFLLSLRPSHLRLVHRVAGEEGEVREKLAMRLQGYLEERDAVLQAMSAATGQMHTYSSRTAEHSSN